MACARYAALLVLALAWQARADDTLTRALALAAEADARLRAEGTCRAADLDLLRAAVDAARTALPSTDAPSRPWRFPLERSSAPSIGGRNGNGYLLPRKLACFAAANAGHAAHDLFVDDPDQNARDASGAPWQALAVDDGLVLITHDGWQPGDPLKGGNYVVLYLPTTRSLAYYAHLERPLVKAGDRLHRGEVVGVLGRSGRNAWPKRSPTHLHFALWDARTLLPVNPYRQLVSADAPTSSSSGIAR